MKGAFGWKEEERVAGVLPISKGIVSPGRARGTRPSLKKLRGPRLFQGRFGACVAFSEVRAIYVSLGARGHKQVMASPKHCYAAGRLQEYAGVDPDTIPPLADTGMFPGIALQAVQRVGFCEWSDDPYGSSLEDHNYRNACKTAINDKVSPRVAREAIDQSGAAWFDLGMPIGRIDAIEDCFDVGMPVLFAMRVDRAFTEHRSSQPIARIDQRELVGGHMMLGLAVTSDGHLLFDNWWDDWGFEDGFGILHRDLVESHLVRNVVAAKFIPTFA